MHSECTHLCKAECARSMCHLLDMPVSAIYQGWFKYLFVGPCHLKDLDMLIVLARRAWSVALWEGMRRASRFFINY